jgi:hypothetical protein
VQRCSPPRRSLPATAAATYEHQARENCSMSACFLRPRELRKMLHRNKHTGMFCDSNSGKYDVLGSITIGAMLVE